MCAARSTQHAAHSTQRAARSTQHTARSTPSELRETVCAELWQGVCSGAHVGDGTPVDNSLIEAENNGAAMQKEIESIQAAMQHRAAVGFQETE